MYLQRMNRANGTQARERNLRDVGTQDGLRSWRFFSRIHKDSMGVSGSLPFKMVISWYLLWILKNFRVISPPARWGLLDFIRVVLLLLLLLFPPPPPSPPPPPPPPPPLPSALPTLRQALCQLPHAVGTAGPQLQGSERTGHRSCRVQWATAGPQPGTFQAQWAPLDLNLGPAELSEHRWTSTWDLPSSVSTAGPQRPDRMPEDMPDRTPDSMSDRMPEDMPDKKPEDMPDRMPEDMPDRMPEGMPDRMSDRMPEGMPDKVPECLPDRTPDRMSEDMPENMPDRVPEDMPEHMPEDMPDRMPENMSDRMPEDLAVTKCINAMVGITRSKVN